MTYTSLDLYSNGLDFFTEVVRATPPDAWDNPSPCEGWTALDVFGHVLQTTAMGARILAGEPVEFASADPPSGVVQGEPTGEWDRASAAARTALEGVDDLDREVDSPMGRRTIREGLSFPGADLFLHGWDLAAASGRSVSIPDEAIAFIRGMFDAIPDEAVRRPGVFGAAADAPEGASATEELMAWCGRAPRRSAS